MTHAEEAGTTSEKRLLCSILLKFFKMRSMSC